jgi:hypothetical protein
MNIQEITKNIDPKRFYTISDIFKLGFFPWANNYITVYRAVMRDMEGRNTLQALSVNDGTSTRRTLRVQGKFLEKYLNSAVSKPRRSK